MSGNENIMKTVEWVVDAEWEDYDCETCGTAYETLDVSVVDGDRIRAHASWGCYSEAGIYDADIAELHRFLDDLPDGFISGDTKAVLLAEVDEELADK